MTPAPGTPVEVLTNMPERKWVPGAIFHATDRGADCTFGKGEGGRPHMSFFEWDRIREREREVKANG